MARGKQPARAAAERVADAAGPPVGPDGKPYTFEQALARLEAIVDELEDGKLALEASIARFEEGVTLTRFLESELGRAQRRVEELVESAGEATTRPWAGDEGDEAEEDEDAGEDVEDEDDDAL